MTSIQVCEQPASDGESSGSSGAAGGQGWVVAGVDTHQRTHHVVVLDAAGRRVGDREFAASEAGYDQLWSWVAAHGEVRMVGVESTGSYGAGLTRHLLAGGVEVVEVNRPDAGVRHRDGKTDVIDAESAARQVLAGTATARPKLSTGIVEAIRTIKVPRDAAVKDRTRAMGQLRDLITTAAGPLHDELIVLSTRARVTKVAAYRPNAARVGEPGHALRYALRALARRIQALDTEIAEADAILATLTSQAVPTLLAMPQIGVQSAAQLVITAGQNLDRMRNEAAFAKLCGVAPVPASSGKTRRMRLCRGGDRQANAALYLIAIGRMRNHPETLAYLARREREGLGRRDIIRCLKRAIARQAYHALINDLLTT